MRSYLDLGVTKEVRNGTATYDIWNKCLPTTKGEHEIQSNLENIVHAIAVDLTEHPTKVQVKPENSLYTKNVKEAIEKATTFGMQQYFNVDEEKVSSITELLGTALVVLPAAYLGFHGYTYSCDKAVEIATQINQYSHYLAPAAGLVQISLSILGAIIPAAVGGTIGAAPAWIFA